MKRMTVIFILCMFVINGCALIPVDMLLYSYKNGKYQSEVCEEKIQIEKGKEYYLVFSGSDTKYSPDSEVIKVLMSDYKDAHGIYGKYLAAKGSYERGTGEGTMYMASGLLTAAFGFTFFDYIYKAERTDAIDTAKTFIVATGITAAAMGLIYTLFILPSKKAESEKYLIEAVEVYNSHCR